MNKGYAVPSPIDPRELECFRVYVPKHTWYIGAFWQAYQYFTTAQAWLRDPLKKGKFAAAVWRVAFDKARTEYELTKGCIMAITDIRIDPLNPCAIQVQIDGGPAWITKLDVSCCGGNGGGASCPVLRSAGGQIEQYDAAAGIWKAIGPVAAAAFDGLQLSVPITDNSGCDSARNYAKALEAKKDFYCDAIADFSFVGAGISFLIASIVPYVPEWSFSADAFAIIGEVYAWLAAHASSVKALDISDDLTCMLVRYFQPNGQITQSGYDSLMYDLAHKATSYSVDTDERAAWSVVWNYAFVFGLVGASRAAAIGNSVGYDCADCGWQHIFDFTHDDGGFIRYMGGTGPLGLWVAGSGWQESFVTGGTGLYEDHLYISRALPSVTLTHVEVTYNAHMAVAPNLPDWPFLQFLGGVFAGTVLTIVAPDEGDNVTLIWDGSEVCTGLSLDMLTDAQVAPALDPGGTGIITRLIVRGDGPDPF